MPSYQQQFMSALTQLSESDEWKDVLAEWKPISVSYAGEDGSHCICEHWILYEHRIKNKLNGNTCVIGSKCIKQFGKGSVLADEVNQTTILLNRKRRNATVKKICKHCYSKKCVCKNEEAMVCCGECSAVFRGNEKRQHYRENHYDEYIKMCYERCPLRHCQKMIDRSKMTAHMTHYHTALKFGKYRGKDLCSVFETQAGRNYLKWVLKNFDSRAEKLKKSIVAIAKERCR